MTGINSILKGTRPFSIGLGPFFGVLDEFINASRTINSYPPYNIQNDPEGTTRLEVAVAGFKRDELSVKEQDGRLIIGGNKPKRELDDLGPYEHRGLSSRSFMLSFLLREGSTIASADLEDGLLSIVIRPPAQVEARTIEIGTGGQRLLTS